MKTIPADPKAAAIEETADGQFVLRLVAFLAPITTDEIAAAGAFEGRSRLLPDGIVFLLAQRGFVTRRLLPGSGVRDVYIVEPTPRADALVQHHIEEYLRGNQ